MSEELFKLFVERFHKATEHALSQPPSAERDELMRNLIELGNAFLLDEEMSYEQFETLMKAIEKDA